MVRSKSAVTAMAARADENERLSADSSAIGEPRDISTKEWKGDDDEDATNQGLEVELEADGSAIDVRAHSL